MKKILCLLLLMITAVIFGCTEDNSVTLPPDPGAAGKTTLEGIDSDVDNVRDDVQIAIHERYPDDEKKRKALGQKAVAIQEAIIAGNLSDTDSIMEASTLVINAIDCLFVTTEDPMAEIGFIEEKVINTDERSEAYIKFNEVLSGQFFGGSGKTNPCLD